jgi:hypothetical protein
MSELLTTGQTFAGRYRIERFLAQGGFGAVYVAEQLGTDLRVALKVLFPRLSNDPGTIDKFQLEARIAGRVRSEHIVQVFDAGFDDATGMPFLVMELLEGQDLEARVQTRGPLEPKLVARLMRQIASALDKAHGYVDREGAHRPIVHRDLKPANLFLTKREDGEPTIKVLDFGIAKVLGDSQHLSHELKGTPAFMAYEQIAAEPVGPNTDVWALGLIGFFLLTGKYYWKAAHRAQFELPQLFAEILSLPLVPPSERASEIGISQDLRCIDAWFARCVTRDRSLRFGSAGECATALASALGWHESVPPASAGVGRASIPETLPEAPPEVPAATGPRTTASVVVVPGRGAGARSQGGLVAVAVSALLVVALGAWFAFRARPVAEPTAAAPSDSAPAVPHSAPLPPASEERRAAPLPSAIAEASAAKTTATPPRGLSAPPKLPRAVAVAPGATSAVPPRPLPTEDVYGDR